MTFLHAARRVAGGYNHYLMEWPIVTNSVTAGSLYGGSDAAAQGLEALLGIARPGKIEYNFARTLRMTTFGTLVAGPSLGAWYPLLHKVTVSFRVKYKPKFAWGYWGSNATKTYVRKPLVEEGANNWAEVGVKLLFDSFFFQAPFLTAYFSITGALEGLSPTRIMKKTTENFHAAWFYGVLLWTPVQMANFLFVPVPAQALLVNVVNAGWKTFLSCLYHARDYGNKGADECTVAELQGVIEEQRGTIELLRTQLEMLEGQGRQ